MSVDAILIVENSRQISLKQFQREIKTDDWSKSSELLDYFSWVLGDVRENMRFLQRLRCRHPEQPDGDAKGVDQYRAQEANAGDDHSMEEAQGKDGQGRERAKGPKEIQTRRTPIRSERLG